MGLEPQHKPAECFTAASEHWTRKALVGRDRCRQLVRGQCPHKQMRLLGWTQASYRQTDIWEMFPDTGLNCCFKKAGE